MTAWVSRLPFSLDPLIAEAKRRMRRRRLRVAAASAAVLLLAGSVLGAALALSSSTAAHAPVVAPAASQLPPLSNLAARAMWCGDAYNASGQGGCHSPDGKWAIVVNNEGKGCTLVVTSTRTGRRTRIGQPDRWGCAPDLWVGQAFVVQEGFDEPQHRVITLTPPGRHVRLLARFRAMVVSPNQHWVAGEAELRGNGTPQLVAVVSLTSHRCRVVTRAASPTEGVSVDKSPWSIVPRDPTSPPSQDPVAWRTIVRDGKRIRVVSGPGTGFTRNSRSVIVGKWQSSDAPPYVTEKRLVKFNLSSLHTPCSASVAPRGSH